jgi:hypothetical protein
MRPLVLITVVALMAGLPVAAQQSATQRRAPRVDSLSASIYGKVTRSDTGGPVRGAEVRLLIDGRSSRLATTDADGRYELRDLAAGEYRVAVSRTGFVPLQFGQRRPFEAASAIAVAEGARAEANVALIRGGVIYGRVLDQTGEPLIGTRVQALRSGSVRGQRRLQTVGASDLTDDTGSFRIYGLPPGDYFVAAAAGLGDQVKRDPPTYYPGTANFTEAQPIALAPGVEASAEFAMAPVRNARVSGVVVDSAGNPVQAMVNLVSEAVSAGPAMGAGAAVGGPSPLQVHADAEANGRFTMENVPPGPYVLTAMVFRMAGPAPPNPGPTTAAQMARQMPEQAAMPLVVNGDDVSGLTIVTTKPSVLTGSIVADTGVARPLPRNVRVTQRSVTSGGTSMSMGSMNDTDFQLVGMAGAFRINVTVPEGWTVKAVMLDGRDVTDEPIDLRGQNATVRVVLSDRPSSVIGTASQRGAPADVDVVVFAEDPTKWTYPSRFVRTTRADGQGRFQIVDLPSGERYLAAALDYLEEGEQDDPQFLERLRARATSFSLIEGQQRAIQLDAIGR